MGWAARLGAGVTVVLVVFVLVAPDARAKSTPAPRPAAWPAPVGCAVSTAFVAQDGPTTLYAGQFGAGAMILHHVGATSPYTYNALGLDPSTGYLYAVESLPASGHVLRIDPGTGAVTDLGPTTPALSSAITWNSGGFDVAGNFYVTSNAAAAMQVIDVATMTTTALALSAPTAASDLVLGAGGYLWGATGNSAPAGDLVRVNVATGQVDFFAAPAGMPQAGIYVAAFGYGNGNVGLVYRGGTLYQVAIADPSTTPAFTVVSTQTAPSSSTGDGASCTSPPTDLQVIVTGPAQVAPGGQVTWQLRVTNNGPAASSGFAIADPVPAGYTAIGASGCAVSAASVSCTGAGLAVGSSSTITVTATAPGTDQCLTNTVTVVGNEAEPAGAHEVADNMSGVRTCVATVAALSLVKRVSSVTELNADGRVVAGDLVRYSVTVVNSGTVALQDVRVVDRLAAPAAPPVRLTCAPALPGAVVVAGASVVCSGKYLITQADVDAGHPVRNTASAIARTVSGMIVRSSASTAIVPVSAINSMTVVPAAATSPFTAGVRVSWPIVVTNTGTTTLTGISVTDAHGGTVTCSATRIVPRQSMICVVHSGPVSDFDASSGRMSQTVTVSGIGAGSAIHTTLDASIIVETDAGTLAATGVGQLGWWVAVGLGLVLAGVCLLIASRRLRLPT